MTARTGSGIGPWLPHLACALVAVVAIALGRARHTTTEDALATALDPGAAVEDRLWGAHLAAMRAEERDPRVGAELARAFLASNEPRLVEFALTMDVVRHFVGSAKGPPPLQAEHLARIRTSPWTAHRLLATLFFQRKVGGGAFGRIERLDLDEARWALDAAASGAAPPGDVLDAHFARRAARAREIGAVLRSVQTSRPR